MKKKLQWAIMPAVAIIAFISLNSFTSSEETGKLQKYVADCPLPSIKQITVCGEGLTTCTPKGNCFY